KSLIFSQVSLNTSTRATSVQSKKTFYLCKTTQACNFSGRHTLKAAMTVCDLRVTSQHSLTVHHNAY
ncbi:hypothetical protein N333_12009, partial [Nestor notabilis]